MENNRNSLIGVILISMLIMALFLNQAKKQGLDELEETVQETAASETTPAAETTTIPEEVVAPTPTATLGSDSNELNAAEQQAITKYGDFHSATIGEEGIVTLENDVLSLNVSTKGAQLERVFLKDFLKHDKTPLYLIDESQDLGFTFNTATNYTLSTSELFYTGEVNGNTLVMTADFGSNRKIEHIYTLEEGSYLVDYDVNFVGMQSLIPAKNTFVGMVWDYNALPFEQNLSREKQKSTIYWKENQEDVDHLAIGKSKDENISNDVDWISFKQQFFNTTLLSKGIFDNTALESTVDMEDSLHIAQFQANVRIPFDAGSDNTLELQYFLGPNDYNLLKKEVGRDMHEVVELSADFFLFKWVKYINKWIILPIFNLLEKVTSNYGIIILLMTFLIKMLLMPLTFKSYISTAKQKLLKPELDALKEKHKDDQQKYAAAQMQLYQKTGVSMFGGCLPTLLQMPILLAMFYFFPSSIELRQESFLWAQDLSTFDTVPWLMWNFNIPLLGSHLSPFTLLMTLSSLLMAKYNTQMQSQPTQPGMEMMKYMPYIFPFFLLFLFNTWPAALTFYYFLSNMITFGQQFVIKRFFINEDKLMEQIQANKLKPAKKKSGFASKLEDIYKQQQQMQAQQKKKKK